MASYTTVEDWKHVEDGYVVAVTIRQTEDEQYPSGWHYSLHLGEVGGETVLRYDNAHERTATNGTPDTMSRPSNSQECSRYTTASSGRQKRCHPSRGNGPSRTPPKATNHDHAQSHCRRTR